MKGLKLLLTVYGFSIAISMLVDSEDYRTNSDLIDNNNLANNQIDRRNKETMLKQEITELEFQILFEREKNRLSEEQKKDLKEEGEKLNKEIDKCFNELMSFKNKTNKEKVLESEIKQLKIKNQEYTWVISSMDSDLTELINKNIFLEKQLKNKKEELQNLQKEKRESLKEISKLKMELKKKEQKTEVFEENQTTHQNEYEKLIQNMNDNISILSQENNELRNIQLSLINDIENKDTQIDKLSKLPRIVLNLEADIYVLKMSLKEERIRNNRMDIEAKEKIDNFNESKKHFQTERLRYETIINELDLANKQAKEEYNVLKSEMKRLRSDKIEIEDLTKLLRDLKIKLKASQEEKIVLRDKINELNNELENINQCENAKKALRQEILNSKNNLFNEKQNLIICKKENDGLKKLNKKLEYDLNLTTNEIDLKNLSSNENVVLIGESNRSPDY